MSAHITTDFFPEASTSNFKSFLVVFPSTAFKISPFMSVLFWSIATPLVLSFWMFFLFCIAFVMFFFVFYWGGNSTNIFHCQSSEYSMILISRSNTWVKAHSKRNTERFIRYKNPTSQFLPSWTINRLNCKVVLNWCSRAFSTMKKMLLAYIFFEMSENFEFFLFFCFRISSWNFEGIKFNIYNIVHHAFATPSNVDFSPLFGTSCKPTKGTGFPSAVGKSVFAPCLSEVPSEIDTEGSREMIWWHAHLSLFYLSQGTPFFEWLINDIFALNS